MAGGRKSEGYAGRKFHGRRFLNDRTPGMPRKHEAWAGLRTPEGFHVSVSNDKGKVIMGLVRDTPMEPKRTLVIDLSGLKGA